MTSKSLVSSLSLLSLEQKRRRNDKLFLFVPKTTRNKAHLVSFLLETTLHKPYFESVNREPRTENRELTKVVSAISAVRLAAKKIRKKLRKNTE